MTERQLVPAASRWAESIGYSRAVRVGSQVFVSGTAAVAPDGSTASPGDPYLQAKRRLEAQTREVRLPADLQGLDGLIIPGGESTTITRLMAMYGLLQPLRDFAAQQPVWGTCAGMIVMARHATDLDREGLNLIDIEV